MSIPDTVKSWFRSHKQEQQETVDVRAVAAPDPNWVPPAPLKHFRYKRISELCKAQDWYTEWYARWVGEIKEPARFHRKQWEFTYVMQSLWERGCIDQGKKGLVFAVGTEPLPSVFANYGCDIVATDIFPER